MSAPRDTTELSDPSKFKLEADGSFKRPATVFHNFIEKGGPFEPQPGEDCSAYIFLYTNSPDFRSLPSLRVVCLPSVFLTIIAT